MRRTMLTALGGLLAASVLTVQAGPAGAATHPRRLHAIEIAPTFRYSPRQPRVDHVQPVGDCEEAAAYIHAHGAPGFTVDCPYPLGTNIAANTGPGTVYIANTACVAAYENEAANTHGHLDSSDRWVTDGLLDPFGPCYTR